MGWQAVEGSFRYDELTGARLLVPGHVKDGALLTPSFRSGTLAIGRDLSLERLAAFRSRLGRALVIEFVPKDEVQVQRLRRNRADIFPGYTVERLEQTFRRQFRIDSVRPVPESARTGYGMTSCHENARA